MNYDALRTFVTIVEEKNFTRAAEKLLISQPSVSLQVKQLENELQTRLLERSPKHLQVTPTGEILYQRAKQILKLYEQAKKEIEEYQQTLSGLIRIGASYTIGEYILPTRLPSFYQKHPEIEAEITIGNTEQIVQGVRTFHLDLGFIEGHTNYQDLQIQPFMNDEMVLIVSANHPIAQLEQPLKIDDLQNQTWISRESGSGTRDYMVHMIRTWGLKVKNKWVISSNHGVKEMVLQGLGISMLSHWVVRKEVEQGDLVVLKISGLDTFKRRLSYLLPLHSESKLRDVFMKQIHGYTW
ncbi:LysR family transcriptional regulator [Hazenella coriacea]|uniref:DNA-binding transcriptional LysR family regulator n=1 Tax=Hazenella coriacea TaxID=1179467 RepID=A0A4V6NZ82_9BACL|nr:LysR substrate-binding domain-containing protein [Hazenella coriacea]TCS93877.1 DNA-binding transcriptional LysR family regulator [Hazenella coriacea]